MADIRIEKKKKVWPWILLIIVLAIVAFLYFYGSAEADDSDDVNNTEIEEVTYNSQRVGILENEEEII